MPDTQPGRGRWSQVGVALCLLAFAVGIALVRQDPFPLAVAALLSLIAFSALYVTLGRTAVEPPTEASGRDH